MGIEKIGRTALATVVLAAGLVAGAWQAPSGGRHVAIAGGGRDTHTIVRQVAIAGGGRDTSVRVSVRA